MNAINVISPYRHLGMWVFDDPRVGLTQEPFVAGADAMIDRVAADIPNAERGFPLIFSASLFPATRSGWNGVGPMAPGTGITLHSSIWRDGYVPRFFRYFDAAPTEVFVEVRGA